MRFLFCIIIMALTSCALNYPQAGIPSNQVRTTLETSTVMFPMAQDKRDVYIKITDDKNKFATALLQQELASYLQSKGYRMQANPNQADIEISLNILFAGTTSIDAANDVLLQGYGAPTFPAGGIAIGKKLYSETAAKSPRVYAVIIDMDIFERNLAANRTLKQFKQYDYAARMLSVYKNQTMVNPFNDIEPNFCKGIAQYIAGIM